MNRIRFYKMIIYIAIISLLASTYAQERDMIHNTVDTNSRIEFSANIPKKKNIGTGKKKTGTIADKKSNKGTVERPSAKKGTIKDTRSKKVDPDQAKEKVKDGSKKVKEEVCTIDGTDECNQVRKFIEKSNKVVDSPIEPATSIRDRNKQNEESESQEPESEEVVE